MPVDTISERPSSDKTIYEIRIETQRTRGVNPSWELFETATGKMGRMRLEPSDGSLVFETNDGVGGGWVAASMGGSGDVVGPASSTDNAVARFDSTTGKLIQDSNATLGDNGGLSLTAAAATEVLGSFIAHASQTANLTEWKSSGGTVGAHVTSSQEFHNTGGGTDSCVYGSGAGVDGDEPRCTSVGVNAVSYGDDSVAIGYGATAGGNGSTAYQDNVAIGSGALSVISSGVAIGAGATTGSSGGSTAIGSLSNVSGNSSVAIGAGASVTGAFGVAIGQGVTSGGSGVTIGRGAAGSNAIGYNADSSGHTQAQAWGTSCTAGALGSVAIGYAADSSHSGSICIGNRAASTASYQLVIGSDYLSGAVKIDNVYIGEGVTSASPDGVTINSTGGEGTDIAGSDITIAGGKGTGNAAGGDIVFSTSDAGASGTSLQSLTEKARIDVDGNFSVVGTLSVGTGNTLGDNDGLSLTATAATEVIGTFTAHASQTANLTEWKSSGGSKLLSVDADGQLVSTLDPNVGDYALTSASKLGLEAVASIWLNTPLLYFVQATTIQNPAGFVFSVGNNTFTISPNSGSFVFNNSNFLATSARLRSSGSLSGNAGNDETAKLDIYNYTSTTTASGTIAELYTSRIGKQTISHASTATTFTDAATLVIEDAPAAGSNVTLTSKWAILVKAGISKFVDVVLTGIRQMLDKGSHPTLATGELADYRKGSLYVIAYNDGGTTKYRYLDLTSTDAVWTYTTTAP